MSSKARYFVVGVVSTFVVTTGLVNIEIRHERKQLQTRAREFLVKPIPKLLVPDANGDVGNFQVDPEGGPQNGVFGYSRVLIARYAINGRIRWSARIQGEFAAIGDGINSNFSSDAIENSQEVRAYLAERNGILSKEWAMGYWQCVEDAMEFVGTPIEIQEEDESHEFLSACKGRWTNGASDVLTIRPDCIFSFSTTKQTNLNNYAGDWILGVGKPSLMLFFTQSTGGEPHWLPGTYAEMQIIQVDKSRLLYSINGKTNQMQR